ncbi:Hypp455 [Branchiostoma lanceolatum]|uniref:Hypp455 protein n=1 Tax=Branchiostoma lanceolatum TaxID=7740 RepID=A0A8J9W0C6_BRALA|nr:Hypp455 [Branchiostoma lanceolatum]
MSSSVSAVVMVLVSGFVVLNVVCVVSAMSSEVYPKTPGAPDCLKEGQQCGLYFHRGEVISPTCCKPLVCGYQDWEYYCLRPEEFLRGALFGKREAP